MRGTNDAANVESVALLALTYSELARPSATGVRTGPRDIVDDLDAIPNQVSLLQMVGSSTLGGVDWKIVEALGHGQALAALYADLADLDPLRAEALLHAWPEDVPTASV